MKTGGPGTVVGIGKDDVKADAGYDENLAERLYRQAGRRWLILAAALAVLAVLGIFAGHVRNPEAVKRQWAVMVSRVLAGAGGVLLARLLLFSYEERVPVLLFDAGSPAAGDGAIGRVANALAELKHRGFVMAPLGDIVEFVREERYVPKKCFGLVIEAEASESIPEIVRALSDCRFTILVPPGALDAGVDRLSALPSGISLGLSLWGRRRPKDEDDLRRHLEGARESIAGLTRGEPGFARVGPVPGVDLRAFLKNTGYLCFLDGRGLNRFGDEPHVLRLFDATPFIQAKGSGKDLAVYMWLFKGKYYAWLAAALTRLTGGAAKGS